LTCDHFLLLALRSPNALDSAMDQSPPSPPAYISFFPCRPFPFFFSTPLPLACDYCSLAPAFKFQSPDPCETVLPSSSGGLYPILCSFDFLPPPTNYTPHPSDPLTLQREFTPMPMILPFLSCNPLPALSLNGHDPHPKPKPPTSPVTCGLFS